MISIMRRLALLVLAVSLALHAGAAGRELGPREVAPTSFRTGAPLTAFNGDRFLTVWLEDTGVGLAMMGAFSNSAGQRISERAFLLDLPPVGSTSQLIATDDGFTLFWGASELGPRMASINREGRVTAIRAVPLPRYASAAFAWNGTHFLGVVERVGTFEPEAALFDREGRAVDVDVPIPYLMHGSDIAVVADHFVAVTAGWDGIFVHTIGDDGLRTHHPIEHTSGRGASQYRVSTPLATALPNGDVLVVWQGGNNQLSELKSIIFRAGGTLSEPSIIATHSAPIVPVEVMLRGSQYVVTFLAGGTLYAATPDSAPVALTQASLDIVRSATSNDALLLVYGGRTQIVSRAIGADGTLHDAQVLSLNLTAQGQPVLSAGGGNVVAAWTEFAGDNSSVRVASVDATGAPRSHANVGRGRLASRELAWSGTYNLALYADDTLLLAKRINAAGRVIDERPIVIAEALSGGAEVGIIWANTHWVVTWSEKGRLRMARVSSAGIAAKPRWLDVHEPLAPGYIQREVTQPGLAFDGKRLLVVWIETQIAPCQMLPPCPSTLPRMLAATLTPDGELSSAMPLELPLDLMVVDGRISIATSGREFMIVTRRKLAVVEARGSRLQLVAQREFGADQWVTGDVTWDARDYVVALRSAGATRSLVVRRLDRNAQDVAPARGTTPLASQLLDPPSIAAAFAGDTLIGVQEGTATGGIVATVYRESELPLLSQR